MNRLASILVLLSFSLFGFFRGAILVNYVINYDYYSNQACENKDKPQLQCKGKCQLDKQLAAVGQSQPNDADPIHQIVKIELSDFCHCHVNEFFLRFYVTSTQVHFLPSTFQVLTGFESRHLRPPSLC